MSRTMVGRRFSDEWKRKISNANKNQTKEGRIEYFKKYGYATLVIWYNELRRNFPLTVEKIINFHNQP